MISFLPFSGAAVSAFTAAPENAKDVVERLKQNVSGKLSLLRAYCIQTELI